MKSPIKIAVTGAAGQIGYSLLFRIASGSMFGPDQPVDLHLIEIAPALGALEGVVMELEDCAFPLLKRIVPTADLDEGFNGVNWALLVGSVPRKQGMERKDLLGINGKIFIGQGQAIERNAAGDVRVLVVGNPCNTNCLIAMNNAKGVPRDRWFAMTRLDENRAKSQLAKRAGVDVAQVTNLAIWGNHSATMYPDFDNARIDGRPATGVIARSRVAPGRLHPHRAAARRGDHQGARLFLRRLGGECGGGYRALAHHADAGGRLVQRRRSARGRVRNRAGPHLLLPGAHRATAARRSRSGCRSAISRGRRSTPPWPSCRKSASW